MKIHVKKYNLVELIPENESDFALIGMWGEMQARLANSNYSSNEKRITSISLQFSYEELAFGIKQSDLKKISIETFINETN